MPLPLVTDIKTISKFAQLEFKLGDAERGRTIFEGIMDSVPKRLDLWFVYVDMEIKQNNVAGVRALFGRILVQKLSSSASFFSFFVVGFPRDVELIGGWSLV